VRALPAQPVGNALVLLALCLGVGAACRRQPAPVRPPQEVQGLRLGGAAPTGDQPQYADNTAERRPTTTAVTAKTDAGLAKAAPLVIPPNATPTVSSPYQPDVNGVHVPLWRQRAKFY
jgi:hypothetical protein